MAGTDRDGSDEALEEVARTFREVSGQAVATLVRVFGDISLAEDAVQDAFVVAATHWRDRIPPNPGGWIVTTARNRAIDHLRRETRGGELARRLATLRPPDDAPADQFLEEGDVIDDRLRLIFTCCHPALAVEHQVALTLRLLGGLSVGEIARAFLVTESTMARRLGRAKYKIKAANIPYRVPEEADIAKRLQPVLAVLYLIYNAGTEHLGEQTSLRREAVRLARQLMALLPNESESAGLVALMLLNESRVPARSRHGAAVLLRDQDRSLWDRGLISEGRAIVRRCIRVDRPGPYQIQAAIQAVHCSAESFGTTDWEQIVDLYDHLMAVAPSPVVALNRAIALSEAVGPKHALLALSEVADDLETYYPLHAARAEMLRRVGRTTEARASYETAAQLATSKSDAIYLANQAKSLEGAAPN